MADDFAERAEKWDANPVRVAMVRALYAEVLRELPALAGKRVLEFGCGTGTLGLRLGREHGARLIFVDTSPAMLAVLRGKLAAAPLAEAQVLEGELSALPLNAASVDAVLCSMSLHHVEDVPGMLRQFRRLLRPGGLVLVADALPEDGSFHAPATVPHNGFDPAALAGQFAAAGFAAGPHRVFHLLQKPAADGAPREYPLFLLAAQAV
jgi:Methylase involved in ubiquinone/menaquinone biosynthesis